MPLSHWDSAKTGFLLDVRQPAELTGRMFRERSTSRSEACQGDSSQGQVFCFGILPFL